MIKVSSKQIRKAGQRKQDLSDESTAKVLKVAKSLARTDFGGQADPLEVIRKKMVERGIEAGPKSCAAVRELLEEQVDGVRRRMFPRMDEAIRRLEAKDAVDGGEAMP